MVEITLNNILDLVEEIDSEDPIDWGMLNIDENTATEMIATSLLEEYNANWSNLDSNERTVIMLATITKLVVENFTLNLKNLKLRQ
jgi:hypothetical protein